jgi:hypothetical protein
MSSLSYRRHRLLDDLGWKSVAAIGDGMHRRLVAQQPEPRVSVTVPIGATMQPSIRRDVELPEMTVGPSGHRRTFPDPACQHAT